jgi:hypothetical protein
VSEKRKRKEAKRALRKDATKSKRPGRVHRDPRGRAHLVLHRDSRGATVRLALSRPLFDEQWQNDLATAAATTAHGVLSERRTLASVVGLARSAMAAASKITEAALARSPDHVLACRAGCSHCCYQAVGVSAPEVFAIYDHLLQTRSAEELEATADRIRLADDATRGMAPADRLSPQLPCPFLEAERCSIYEVRPLACRGKNSLDAALCERTLRDADSRAAFLDGTLSVPCYLEPLRACHSLMAGMELSLHELHQLQTRPLELTAAVRIMVDDPEIVSERWLAGEDPFEGARGADATNDPRLRALSGRRADV